MAPKPVAHQNAAQQAPPRLGVVAKQAVRAAFKIGGQPGIPAETERQDCAGCQAGGVVPGSAAPKAPIASALARLETCRVSAA